VAIFIRDRALHQVYDVSLFRLHRMHEMQTIVTDDRVVCPPVCQSVYHAGSFSATFAKLLWPLVQVGCQSTRSTGL